MAKKYEVITALYAETLENVANSAVWQDFLTTASRNFRLTFEEQVLLFAQRPDATAVLPISGRDGWNQRFGLWVNKGAKGIAMFDQEHTGRSQLKYYFDISDTHEGKFPRPVPLWEVKPEHEQAIIETLENHFGVLSEKTDLPQALRSAAENATEDHYGAYLDDLKDFREGSHQEYTEDTTLGDHFKTLLCNSISYMLLCRSGFEPKEYFTDSDFSYIREFNTVDTINAIGTATRDISQMCLSEIGRTVLAQERVSRTVANRGNYEYAEVVETDDRDERSIENDELDLHHAGGLPVARPPADTGTGDSPWEIRIDAERVSEEKPQSAVYEPADQREAEHTFDGSGTNRTESHGADRDADGEGHGRDGADEGIRPDEMGGIDEQHQGSGGGSRAAGSDLQLNEESAGGESLPAFLDETLIFAVLENKDDDLKRSKYEIEQFFLAENDAMKRAAFLKETYPDRYTELIVDGKRIGYKAMDNGLLMWEGAYLSRTKESVFSWGLTAELTGQLIEQGTYFLNTTTKRPKPVTEQMSFLDGDYDLDEPDDEAQLTLIPKASLSQQVIDEALCLGFNDRHSRQIICAYFMKDKPLEDNAAFLKRSYGDNGAGFYFNERPYSVWYDGDGIRISSGTTAQKKTATTVTWEQAAKRIRELLDLGRYMPQNEIDGALDYERRQLADSMLYIARDISEEYRDAGYLPTMRVILSTRATFPEMSKQVQELLTDSDMLQRLVDEWTLFAQVYEANPDVLCFRYRNVPNIPVQMMNLQRVPLVFQSAEIDHSHQLYISDDEIDRVLRGGERQTDYRLAVYSHFAREKDIKSREQFLKNYHGDSGSHGGNDNREYSAKGLKFSHGSITAPYAKTELSWNQVAKRISDMIAKDKFLTEADKANMPDYEMKQLARLVHGFFSNAPQEYERPYHQNPIMDYWEGIESVAEQLKDPDRMEEIYQTMMVPLWENTANIDRYYDTRQKAMDAIEQYRKGTYSVFGTGKSLYQFTTVELPEEPEPVVEAIDVPTDEAVEVEIIEPPAKKIAVQSTVGFDRLHPEIPDTQRNNYRITNAELGCGTPGQKYAANIAAIRTLKRIEQEDRLATPEEQEILSKYVGWGGLSVCFEETHSKYAELKGLLSEEEYAAARASSLTAFYTSPVIIQAIYNALHEWGFREGNILEPSCGVGNFIGMLPDSMANSHVYGVELDSISGRIAQQLYQNNSIAVTGFEKVNVPDSFFDIAIGNVPFGDFRVLDKRYDKHHWLIHDYFFGKTLDKVRPGGVVAFVTSKGTMDKENSSVRKYLAQRADLIGAVRLPNTAFKQNAGTEVTSDILFLQKRDRMIDIEPDWVHLDTDDNGIRMNSYFVQNPDMILGEMVMESTRFGMDSVCKPYEGVELSTLLEDAISSLHTQIAEYEHEDADLEDDSIPADPNVRNFSYTLVDGKLYFRTNSRMNPVQVSATAENRIRGMIQLRECVRTLIDYQTQDYPDADISREQQRLNTLYDDYTGKYGLLCSRGNSMAFGEDSSYFLLCSLEVLDEEGNFKRKADMFTKRTIRPHVPVQTVDTASEALAVSIAEKAAVDMEYMSELSAKSTEELEKELNGVIFRDINCAENAEEIPLTHVDLERYPFVTADEYLSGNVRRKLRMAKAMQEVLPTEKKSHVEQNISALTAVQPVDLTAGEIGVRIGVNWIPIEIYEQFMFELLGTNYYARSKMKVLYSKHSGEWNITAKSSDSGNIKAITTYGTKRINAYHILEQTLNQKDVRIYDTKIGPDGNEIRILNKKETAIAQDRQELIKTQFAEWIWKDIDRREMLCSIYNETFNAVRPREYDGQHIRFPGMNPEITLRKHQIDAIAHIMYGGNTLLAHEVGAGKTFEMVAAAMESKRLGLCTKSLVVVPNHLTEQWASEWLQLYPSANILVAKKKDFETKNRKKFCARIATGDYDAIIIGHTQFEKIPISYERQEAILRQQINTIMESIAEAKRSNSERYSIKQMERTRKSLETKLAKLNDRSRKDDVVTFEQLGVDRVFVDESHYFKNLFLATKMRNVGGIAQTEAQKSSDLFMKCRYLDEITDNRGVIFATGTPISNSMVELYTIQRYLQYSTLEEMDMLNFDDWAANFGETITAIELSPEGSGYRSKTRFAKFYNLPELMSTFKMVADIQTADMLKLPVPKANFHTEVIQPSEGQQDMVAQLADRAEDIRAGNVDPSVDNMLKITNDGRKLALDLRLVEPMAEDDANGKVTVCARNVHRIWEQTQEKRSTQLVFCDLSTPKGDGSFNVYDDLKQKLIDKGIPAEEIAFIHDAKTDVQKKELFGKVRSGQIRVLMGSTQKMGAGTNVQDKLIALHDLDCPWRPSDLAQRLGRIVRQGNENPEVEVFRYVTEGTFDAYLYQLVENKQRFIAQIMTGKAIARIADDVDETALNYSEIKALATGNPLIIEKCNLDMDVAKLTVLKANHMNQHFALENLVLRKYPAEIARLTAKIGGYEKDVQIAKAHPKAEEGFVGMEIRGKRYTERKDAGKAIIDACSGLIGSEAIQLGWYRGFPISLEYDRMEDNFYLTFKGALSHKVRLGGDISGNITRMDNLVDGMENALQELKADLQHIQTQLTNTKAELETPFAKEAELAEKSARLKELDILLNMDEKDHTLLDEALEENEPERSRDKDIER